VGQLFLVGQVVLEERVGLLDQRDQVDPVVLEDQEAVVDMSGNFVALALVVSCHRVQFHPDDQPRQAYRLDQGHQVYL